MSEKIIAQFEKAGMEDNLSKVLIIDDDQLLSEVLKEALEGYPVSVTLARDGEEGLRKIHTEPFSFVICDISMPKISGDQLIPMIKDSPYNKETPVIALSGSISGEITEKIKDDVVNVFVKPAPVSAITKYILQHLKMDRES